MLIGVIHSNKEMLEVYLNLSKTYDTYLIDEFSKESDLIVPDIIVFPINGIDEEGNIKGNHGKIILNKAFYKQLKDKKIFAGIHVPFLQALQYPIHYYLEDQQVIMQNAVFTAEGVLFLLIDCTQLSILELKIDLIGYGVCGKVIYDLLKAMGAHVRVIRREVDISNEDMISIQRWKQMECGDVIINTAPAVIIDRERMSSFIKKPVIIDIASGNQIDEKDALYYGIRLIQGKSLPAIFASKSAGKLIGEYIRGIIDAKE
ncbi:MAG: hypothetical protein RR863_03865 [Erysipelotrichaceae bacterium]